MHGRIHAPVLIPRFSLILSDAAMLPDWAPNLHPLVIHFPIALLFTAALVDTVGMALRSNDFLRKGAFSLYLLGTLAVVAAWFTGEQAADSVFLATEANALLTEHSDLGHYVLYFFGGYALIRLLMFGLNMEQRTALRAIVWLIGVGGIGLTWITAEHGAELVFRYGAGVQAVSNEAPVFTAPDSAMSAGPVMNDAGGWTFKPTRASAWMDAMTVHGNTDNLTAALMDGGDRGDVLALSTSGDPVMMTFDQDLASVQIDGAINLDDFDGTLMFVTHVIDAENYHFTSYAKGSVRQGRSENGDLILMDDQPLAPEGWINIRAVADMTHFRAYADQQLVAHGHGDDPGMGPVGIRLNGTGTVLIDYVQTSALRGGMDH